MMETMAGKPRMIFSQSHVGLQKRDGNVNDAPWSALIYGILSWLTPLSIP